MVMDVEKDEELMEGLIREKTDMEVDNGKKKNKKKEGYKQLAERISQEETDVETETGNNVMAKKKKKRGNNKMGSGASKSTAVSRRGRRRKQKTRSFSPSEHHLRPRNPKVRKLSRIVTRSSLDEQDVNHKKLPLASTKAPQKRKKKATPSSSSEEKSQAKRNVRENSPRIVIRQLKITESTDEEIDDDYFDEPTQNYRIPSWVRCKVYTKCNHHSSKPCENAGDGPS
ncbi:protein FAM133 [Amborella trichopoda]|nr:protein FAM133 [Amborella trichopoda]|eukprot:XP_011625356.1 protein FAM133 [Amborella trichopoda]